MQSCFTKAIILAIDQKGRKGAQDSGKEVSFSFENNLKCEKRTQNDKLGKYWLI